MNEDTQKNENEPHVTQLPHDEQFRAIQAKSAKTRRERLTAKEKAFSAQFVKKRNGTQAALAVYDTKDKKTAGVIAHENLAKPKVRAEIERLLHEQGIELSEIVALHARNARQNKHLPTSQKAVTDFYELLGLKASSSTPNSINVAFVIEK